MKSTLYLGPTQPKPFPKLMKHKDYDTIVLFTSSTCGTLLYRVGKTIDTHFTNLTESMYEDMEGSVTLTNE